ncbi:hypothetical protein BURMUCGD1_2799 [Burkholderia multivorans CGD1]|nr:hypothetical protein BURMUCGD1_2799 [Burkholderia multivorans CGD1]
MHRRSPCRCTFCSRAAAYAVGRRAGRRPNDYRRAKKGFIAGNRGGFESDCVT